MSWNIKLYPWQNINSSLIAQKKFHHKHKFALQREIYCTRSGFKKLFMIPFFISFYFLQIHKQKKTRVRRDNSIASLEDIHATPLQLPLYCSASLWLDKQV